MIGATVSGISYAFAADASMSWGDLGRGLAGAWLGGAVSGALGASYSGGFLGDFVANAGFTAAGQGVSAQVTGNMPNANEFLARSVLGGLTSATGVQAAEFLPGKVLATVAEAGFLGGAISEPLFSLLNKNAEPGYFNSTSARICP